MKVGSIYAITNTMSGKIYVGQTWMTLAQRWKAHIKASRRINGPRKSPFHCSVQSYGADAFTICNIGAVYVSQEELDAAEVKFIKELRAQDASIGYNLLDGGSNAPSAHQEVRDKIAATLTGRKRTPESIAAQLASRQRNNYHHSEVTKEKMSISQKGRAVSEETRAKLSIVASLRGMKHLHTPEIIAKSAASRKGRIVSQETRDKIGAKSAQKVMSEDARARIASSIRRLRAERFWSTSKKSQSAITSPQV